MQSTATKSKLPRIRTVQQCWEHIKGLDPDCCISEWFIRQLCKNNQIKYFPSGSKVYVNMDYLLNYLGYSEVQSCT